LEQLTADIDILLTDISMPIMTGLELAEKAKSRHPGLKVLFISGYEDFHFARKAITVGAEAYVLKPVDDAELIVILRQLVERLDRERATERASKEAGRTIEREPGRPGADREAPNAKPSRKIVAEMIRYLNGRLGDNLTLRDVADAFGFSPNYLGTLFKEDTGVNFSDYLIASRLDRARELLDDPRLKIYEIAEKVGHKNLPYFSKQFKERFGMTPGEFRKQGGPV
jgi:YesN/AraC family two-component response regulator